MYVKIRENNWIILLASGNYSGRLDLVIPIAHRLLALKLKGTPCCALSCILGPYCLYILQGSGTECKLFCLYLV